MRVILRALARLCRRRSAAAMARAMSARFASVAALEVAVHAERRLGCVQVDYTVALRNMAELEEDRARVWARRARDLEAL